jgi:hypothetical protein
MKPQHGTAVIPTGDRPAPRAARLPVLIALHPDGWCEVYGDREQVNVHIGLVLATEQPEELLALDYFERMLPLRFRDTYTPVNLIASGLCERRTAADELARRTRLDFLAGCRDMLLADADARREAAST